ncbi:MAG: amino acid racemase [Pseudolysinimonas sp.]
MIEAATTLPLLHIADPTGEALVAAGVTRVGLLGTGFTMDQPFYADRLRENFGLDVLVPQPDDREAVHGIIYDELVLGDIRPASREVYRAVMQRLVDAGAEAIILGCTEITLLVGQDDATVSLFDTTTLHAVAAVERALLLRAARRRGVRLV